MPFRPRLALASVALVAPLLATACGGGGGGGSGGFATRTSLLAITFPDPNDVNVEPEDTAPTAAPLVQTVEFRFGGRIDPDRVSRLTLPVTDASGFPVPGGYVVDGATVTFVPALPTRPVVAISETGFDSGGCGLLPDGRYFVRAGPGTADFITAVESSLLARYPDPADARGVLIGFQATADPARFLGALPRRAPLLVTSDPADGESGISPNLYADPQSLFPPRRTFTLTFDGPLQPATANVSNATFTLIDLDDRPTSFPLGLPLGVDVRVLSNEVDASIVEVAPSGILPFGHLLALEIPDRLLGLSEEGAPGSGRLLAATFTIAAAGPDPVADELVETFDDTARRESDPGQFATVELPADWDAGDSNILEAGFAFAGDGLLGRFTPIAPSDATLTKKIVLDTSRQFFPLFDGSTPDAPPGTEVLGGVFSFTDIDIPDRVVIELIGPNPCVLTATGSIRIAGQLIANGQSGTPDNAYDSAVSPVPGGAGGVGAGRGGEGHPILFFPPDQVSYLGLVSPPYAGTGLGPQLQGSQIVMKAIGGRGGQCGCLDHVDASGHYSTDVEITCNEFNSSNSFGEKVPGGGGGSFLVKGKKGGAAELGIGNVLATGTGSYVVRPYSDPNSDPNAQLAPGPGGEHPFVDDGNASNDFIGTRGQLTRLQGGQGGGGGASKLEGYYCGFWCKVDADPDNDGNCMGGEFGGLYGDSVGDARGGGAGGGGGAIQLQALGAIQLDGTASLQVNGGRGAGGESLGCATWGAASGGGSGGALLLQSATGITVSAGATLQTVGGLGEKGTRSSNYLVCDRDGGPGTGGNGGGGIIQLQVPAGDQAVVVDPAGSIQPPAAWVDPTNVQNPAEFTATSVGQSSWYDLGRMTQRGVAGTQPVFSFRGLDALGFVPTDASGFVIDPTHVDIECDDLGQIDPLTHQYRPGREPREDFIPTNATIRVEFQAADPLVEGSKEVDPATVTLWSSNPATANGHQFLRWRVTFDLTADGSALAPDTPRPVVQRVRVGVSF